MREIVGWRYAQISDRIRQS